MSLRPEVRSFADTMENTLLRHDSERGSSWRGESIKWLLDRLKSETKELIEAFENCDPKAVREECIDVANFAMFIFTKLKERKT